ncbi:MAG: DUF58 domain-containing protein [Clostridium sp.]|nr:DUF58 domain-containing protein [Clostridium sp.]MCM1398523.1 DUF58 domain-containing protein [Clostridium sp.]MCM1460245.1 DUF58 domain-containing protein [Bacteroides sp.]
MRLEVLFRTIGLIILYAICLALYLFLHSQFYLIVLIIMVVGPLLSILMASHLRDKTGVRVMAGTVSTGNPVGLARMEDLYGRQDEELFFCIKLDNPTLFVSLDVKLTVEVANLFFGVTAERKISVPLRAKTGYEFMLPIVPRFPGTIKVTVKKIEIKDLSGLCFFKKNIDADGEATVLPRTLKDVKYDKNDAEAGMLESEESNKRGNDFSDVQEIREYIPGDKLMSIHWKLSAKRDILMVKDRVSMSDRQLVVVPELCGADPASLNMIVTAAYSVISEMIEDKTSIRLIYWSRNRDDYEETRIDYKEDLQNTFAKMFYEKTYMSSDEAAANMASVHPEIKAYLHISAENRSLKIQVRENI